MMGTFVDLKSVRLKVCHTTGHFPAVVFIHGGLGNRFNWRSQWEFLRSQGRAAVAYDLAGHGESGQYRRYSIGRHRRDLTRLLKHFKLHAPILCCHSYGVPLGLEWATRHHASALILIGGGTHNLTPWWEVPVARMLSAGGYRLYNHPPVQKLTRPLFSQHATETVDRFLQESPLPQNPHPYQAMESFWNYDGRLSPIACPVLVITGENDRVFPPDMGEELVNHFSQKGLHSQHLVIPNAGHLLMAEAPEQVNQAILQMIETVKAGGARG